MTGDRGVPLMVDTPERPRISVVMPVFGRLDTACSAIRALVANTEPCFELLLVDNAATEGDADQLDTLVSGATVLRHPVNLGFGAAANLGVLHARGDLVLLLNSDAFVEPGWLDPLVEALRANAELAAVSPMFFHMDGTPQEAGSVIFNTGATQAFLPEPNWGTTPRRVLPYISAACLLVRRSAFIAIGGFEPAYGLGYFEDVEFAFDLRRHGWDLCVVPESRVRHIRGGSSESSTAHRLHHHNRRVFVDRWRDDLAPLPSQPMFADESAVIRACDATMPERILIIDDRIPHTDRGSGDPRMALMLTRMTALWPTVRVTLLAADPSRGESYAPPLLRAGIEVAPCGLADAEGWLSERTGHFSTVIVSRPTNFSRYRTMIDQTQPQALRVVDVEAIYSTRSVRQSHLVDDEPQRSALLSRGAAERAAEFESWHWADVVISVSPDEADMIRQVVPGARVCVVSSAATVRPAPTREERRGAVFFGGFMGGESSPNTDSVHYLANAVLPLIHERLPDLTLSIAGADPPASVRRISHPRIEVIGAVDHPSDALGPALVHLAPVRYGAGVKLKLIESMAVGTPFVTTPFGAEGLGLSDDLRQLLVAERPAALARLATDLLIDAELWHSAHTALLRHADEYFSMDAFDGSMCELMAEFGVAPPVAARLPISSPTR